jgi:Fe-S-cluster containining protein
MDDERASRLNELVTQLTSEPGYATGTRRFPHPVPLADAIAIAAALQAQVDGSVEARTAHITELGLELACKRGCNGCCEEPIMVYRPEAVAVVRFLRRPEHAEIRAGFLARYPAWKAAIGDTPQRLSDLAARDPEAHLEVHMAGWRKRVMCAFNHDGACTIYEVRPIVCRGAHALDTSEHCHGGTELPSKVFNFVPLDQVLRRSRGLLQATHNAIGGPRGRVEALPNIVYHLLTRR